jgi:hypothetical protein
VTNVEACIGVRECGGDENVAGHGYGKVER